MAFALLCCADFSQSAECLPVEARGKQCVTSCLMYLITACQTNPVSMQTSCLNDILFAGSHMYSALCEATCTSGLIDPENLPCRLVYKSKTWYVVHEGVKSGFIQGNSLSNVHTNHTLGYAFREACLEARHKWKKIIIVFSGMSVGIYSDGVHFYVFDSHARGSNGMSDPDGKCVLGVVKSVDELCLFLQSLASSVNSNTDSMQFDLHTFEFPTRYRFTPFSIEILDRRQGFTVKRVQKRVAKQDRIFHAKMLKLMDGKSFRNVVDDRHDSSGCSEVTPGSGIQNLLEGRNLRVLVDDLHVDKSPGVLAGSNYSQEELIACFTALVSSGPNYVCTCCTQTFFSHSMKSVDKLQHDKKATITRYLTNLKSVDGFEWICQACFAAASHQKIPKFWVHNGLKFPDKPTELDLSNLEERLVCPRLPFMQLREMPRGGQINLKGNIVNVPADVNNTIKSLPRMLNENETIMLKLKRKLSYKHHVAFENIRPNKVFNAVRWLIENSVLFRNEGIVVNENWLQFPHEIPALNEQLEDDGSASTNETGDGWTEDDSCRDRLTGNLDTCLQAMDFREFNQVLSVAPGEANSPISIFQDIHSEALSFPVIFCGNARVTNDDRFVPLHYSEICKWELRNVDRRVALCVPNIFFKLKRLQIKQIRDKVSLAVRKCKTKGATFTAGDILSPGFVEKLTMQNDGYRVLRTLRGSPPYWEASKRDVFAMIRQLGIPTWFCSFSAAETKWVALLRSLAMLVQGKELSTEQIDNLTWSDKCLLIKSDPVTCARYFDHRVQNFLKHVLHHKSQPIGEILDFFYRVEFQQRGSPHIHMVIWVNGAPVHGVSSDTTIAAFVDKYVSCCKDDTMPELINYQTHRHAPTCRKNGKSLCRFNFPIPPMPETIVLQPLIASEGSVENAGMYEQVLTVLNDTQAAGDALSFDDFLGKLGIDYDTYLRVIRSSLTRAKVFLKRSVSENRVNNYNCVLLKSWQANMDIQYILDPFSCVSYIVSYISKGQRGLSNLLSDACSEAQEIDSDVRQQVRRIGNQFLSSVEIGAQEAVYLVLQMPLRRCSREVVFIDTKKTNDRTALIKPLSALKELPANSKNVEMDSVLKRYKRRPKVIELLCYADFASWYQLCPNTKEKMPISRDDGQELLETEYEHDTVDELDVADEEVHLDVIQFACGVQLRKRKRQKVLYSHVTPLSQDAEEHYREKIMLYSHWRDDETDLLGTYQSFEESFDAKSDEIKSNQSKYEKNDESFYESISEDLESEQLYSAVHPEAHHQEMIDQEETLLRSEMHGCFDPGPSAAVENYDLGEDLGISRKHACSGVLPQQEMDNERFLENVRKLNCEQKRFFTISCTKSNPIHYRFTLSCPEVLAVASPLSFVPSTRLL